MQHDTKIRKIHVSPSPGDWRRAGTRHRRVIHSVSCHIDTDSYVHVHDISAKDTRLYARGMAYRYQIGETG